MLSLVQNSCIEIRGTVKLHSRNCNIYYIFMYIGGSTKRPRQFRLSAPRSSIHEVWTKWLYTIHVSHFSVLLYLTNMSLERKTFQWNAWLKQDNLFQPYFSRRLIAIPLPRHLSPWWRHRVNVIDSPGTQKE